MNSFDPIFHDEEQAVLFLIKYAILKKAEHAIVMGFCLYLHIEQERRNAFLNVVKRTRKFAFCQKLCLKNIVFM